MQMRHLLGFLSCIRWLIVIIIFLLWIHCKVNQILIFLSVPAAFEIFLILFLFEGGLEDKIGG